MGGVPGNAVIVSATLDIVINSIQPQPLTGTIPIRIDLVSFQPPTLLPTDFDRTLQPALATITITPPISQADFGNHVFVDVGLLMQEAQRLGLPDFQVRILEDLGAVSPDLSKSTTPRERIAHCLHLCWRFPISDTAGMRTGNRQAICCSATRPCPVVLTGMAGGCAVLQCSLFFRELPAA